MILLTTLIVLILLGSIFPNIVFTILIFFLLTIIFGFVAVNSEIFYIIIGFVILIFIFSLFLGNKKVKFPKNKPKSGFGFKISSFSFFGFAHNLFGFRKTGKTSSIEENVEQDINPELVVDKVPSKKKSAFIDSVNINFLVGEVTNLKKLFRAKSKDIQTTQDFVEVDPLPKKSMDKNETNGKVSYVNHIIRTFSYLGNFLKSSPIVGAKRPRNFKEDILNTKGIIIKKPHSSEGSITDEFKRKRHLIIKESKD